MRTADIQRETEPQASLRPEAAPGVAASPSGAPRPRPEIRGPSFFVGEEKLVVRGVTYGTFAPDAEGHRFPARDVVRRDFAMMRAASVNAIRTYTAPPAWLLDEARAAGLRVLVGIHWEGRDCRYDDPAVLRAALDAVRSAVRGCRSHRDVVLAYVVGNEIPPLTARFHGRRTIESFLWRLYRAAKSEDPGGLVTYGNYPSTEFLQVEFFDFYTLNVYLLEKRSLSRYLDRMMIHAKGKPLVIGEIGDDSRRRGSEWQASLLDWTIPLVLDKGVAGMCVFSWTDEWVVGEVDVRDWEFGLVDRDRRPKAALDVVARRYSESPFARRPRWPRVSVVVCNYNGAETLDETLCSLERLDYPDYEVILVEDGSTDASSEIAARHEPRIRVIRQENRGLSAARNVGLEAATGDVVAYIDSDAYADRDWLRHLVIALESGDYAGVGGPNLTPASDGLVAQFIAACPGNPTHILKTDVHAEHIAGVNMAYRREALRAIDGFDPVHRRAGDDVDVCWRFEDAQMALAFAPAAIVWHHRRPSVARYLKQQMGYGEAENQLERKHPERFNLGGYIRWAGRIYLAPHRVTRFSRPFIYHGRLGTAPFQSLYQKQPSLFSDIPRTAQWYLVAFVALCLTPATPWAGVAGLAMLLASATLAFADAIATEIPIPLTFGQQLRKTWTIGSMNFLHPVVRWYGRARAASRIGELPTPLQRLRWWGPRPVLSELLHGLRRGPELRRFWGAGSGQREALVRDVQGELKARRVSAAPGREWDNHDLALGGSLWSRARFTTAPEHYDQALCCGLRVGTTRIARLLWLSTAVGAVVAAVLDSRLLPLLAVPLLVGVQVLGQRARLRAELWRAVAASMERAGAKPYAGDRA